MGKAMILEAISYVAEDEPYWTFVAARIYLQEVYAYEERRCNHDVYQHFGDKVQQLVEEGLYNPMLVEKYSEEELRRIGDMIVPERDRLFEDIVLKTVIDRYCTMCFSYKK